MPEPRRPDEADSQAETVSWGDLLAEAQRRLARSAAVESPEVDARRIVEAASGVSPAEFDRVCWASRPRR